jgi:carboxyl-terminal processing protease
MLSIKRLSLLFAVFLITPAMAAEFDEAAELVNHLHIAHPSLADIPRDGHALNSFLSSLDPYSRYYNPPEYLRLNFYHKGNVRGLGGLVTRDKSSGRTLFIPFKDGPAAKAGLHTPIILQSLNGRAVGEQTPRELAKTLDKMQRVRVSGKDIVSGAHFNKILPLRKYMIPETEDMLVDGLRILRIHHFEESSTASSIKKWLQSRRGNSPIIIDLRYTTGGSLFESIDSASLFATQAGSAASTIESNGEEYDFTLAPAIPPVGLARAPVYLLVGPQTASAGEVFARALDYHHLAVTLGQKTFGKCVIQRSFDLQSGGGITLTVGRLLDPAGSYCNGEGLKPDVVVSGDHLYNTEYMVYVISKYRNTHFLTCLKKSFFSTGRAIAMGKKIGWNDGIGELRPVIRTRIAHKNSLWQYCLAPALTHELAKTVAARQQTRIGQAVKVISLVNPSHKSGLGLFSLD